MFRLFAALAEFERALILERTKAGRAAARARGRNGGAPFKMTPARLRLAQAAMGKPGTKVADLCAEHGITPRCRPSSYRRAQSARNDRQGAVSGVGFSQKKEEQPPLSLSSYCRTTEGITTLDDEIVVVRLREAFRCVRYGETEPRGVKPRTRSLERTGITAYRPAPPSVPDKIAGIGASLGAAAIFVLNILDHARRSLGSV